ncbi:Tyrosinase [Lasiodiplodia theobromae]|uniref:tyrosinase n=1 Tax=Lasiodiplodia theobromae TaxID=45133 RepID=A0A5N5CW49_9PEZI|nr:Tyrosinase [Lasiodiplodia theobromae]
MAPSTLETAQDDGVVIGLKSLSNVEQRLEIDELLVKHPDVFNLFLLALERLQQDQSKMGYFKIAGIHGLPTENWDNVQGDTKKVGGYCTHGFNLFPTWHRPYLAMMEQTIYNTAGEIAKEFKDQKYLEAAKQFRLPYWDYFKPREQKDIVFTRPNGTKATFPYDFRLPEVLKQDKLMVYRPGNEEQLGPMDNPLKSFRFPKKGSIPLSQWQVMEDRAKAQGATFTLPQDHTVRHAVDHGNGKDNFEELDTVLNKAREQMVIYMLNLLEVPNYGVYDYFATTGLALEEPDPNAPSGSLEGFHDTYHGHIGGAGHMSRIPVAAFDPVFWLHHCNIDRIFAVWQATHDKYITDGPSYPNATTKLYPFRYIDKASGKMWTSATARNHTDFGYTYPDLVNKPNRQAILADFDANYRWSLLRKARLDNKLIVPKDMQPNNREVVAAQVFDYTAAELVGGAVRQAAPKMMEAASMVANTGFATTASAGHGPPGGPEHVPSFGRGDEILKDEPEGSKLVLQWYIDTIVNKTALNGSFTIFFFLGPRSEIPSNPIQWQSSRILAGTTHIFSAPREACDNCALQEEHGHRVTGTTAIKPILLDYIEAGQLQSLSPRDVVPFLKKELVWRVADVNRQQKDPARVEGLRVDVSATVSVLRPDSTIPRFKEPLTFPEVTEGRSGGDPV